MRPSIIDWIGHLALTAVPLLLGCQANSSAPVDRTSGEATDTADETESSGESDGTETDARETDVDQTDGGESANAAASETDEGAETDAEAGDHPEEADGFEGNSGPAPLPLPEDIEEAGDLPSGTPCSLGADCGSGSTCVAVGQAGGASKDGFCTRPCDEEPCGDGDSCVELGGQELCLRGCAAGRVCGSGSLCTESPDGDVCSPRCNSSDDCEVGNCDPGSGLCSDVEREGAGTLPTGMPCETAGTPADCEGLCTELSGEVSACSRPCRQGYYEACDICLPLSGEFVTGAPGSCFQSCGCNVNCYHSDAICVPIAVATDASPFIFPSPGVCMPVDLFPDDPGIETCDL